MAFAQVLVNSIVRASELALLSLGLTIVYDILRFANFAHTEFAVVGVYITLFLNVTLGWHIVPSAIISSLATGILSSHDRAIRGSIIHSHRPGTLYSATTNRL